eukprot:scaffold40400_cov73-Phaeocystis_antarctica.AAC.1
MGVQHTMLRVWHTQTHVTAAEVRAYLASWGRSARLGRPGVALGRPFTPVKPLMHPLGPRAVGPLRLGSNSIATPRGAN